MQIALVIFFTCLIGATTLGLAVAETVEQTTKKKAETKNESGQPLKKEDLPKDAQPPPTHTKQTPPKPE
jgi:hypothetical protein